MPSNWIRHLEASCQNERWIPSEPHGESFPCPTATTRPRYVTYYDVSAAASYQYSVCLLCGCRCYLRGSVDYTCPVARTVTSKQVAFTSRARDAAPVASAERVVQAVRCRTRTSYCEIVLASRQLCMWYTLVYSGRLDPITCTPHSPPSDDRYG